MRTSASARWLALCVVLGSCRVLAGAAPAATTKAATPKLTLSASTLSFGSVITGQASQPQSITLTNPGKSRLTLGTAKLSDSLNYTLTSTCGKTLAAAAHCFITVTFKPQSASAFNATVTIPGTSASSSKSVALTGTGASVAAPTLHTEPDEGFTWLYTLVNGAQKTLDMTMYELVDTTFSADLVTACNRGVKVRVVLDQSREKSSNTAAYSQLNAVANCSAVWSNLAFQATHEKSIVLDGTTAIIMTFNLTSRFYPETRDFGLVETNATDIAAIKATFAADIAAGTPGSGVAGASDFSYQPGAGSDLIWSPTTAQADLLATINNAQKTLLVENEEMAAANIVSALESACKRGVATNIAMTDTSVNFHANYTALEAAGCGVHIGANNPTTLYIHAKAILADVGLPTQQVYMGSINFSIASMTENRELGLFVTDPTAVQSLQTAILSDYTLFPTF